MANRDEFDPSSISNLNSIISKMGLNSEVLEKSMERVIASGKKMTRSMNQDLRRGLSNVSSEMRKIEKEMSNYSSNAKNLSKIDIQRYNVLKNTHSELLRGYRAGQEYAKSTKGMAESSGILQRSLAALSAELSMVRTIAISGFNGISAVWNSLMVPLYESWFQYQSNITRALGTMARSTGATGQTLEQFGGTAEGLRDTFRELGDEINGVASYEFIQQLAPLLRDSSLMSHDIAMNLLEVSQGLGVGPERAVELFRLLRSGFDGTHQDIEQFSVDMDVFAHSIGANSGQLLSEFIDLRSQVAQFGHDGVDSFRRAASMAQEFGFQARVIFDMASRFDTFGQASESINQMNAMLGTSISSFELMMEQDPSRRIEMLRDAFNAEGISWDSMSRQQRQMMAQVTGQSEDILARVFSQGQTLDQIEADQQRAEAEESARAARRRTAEEQMQEILADTSTLYRGIRETISEIVAVFARDMGPMFEGFHDTVIGIALEVRDWIHALDQSTPAQQTIHMISSDMRDIGGFLRENITPQIQNLPTFLERVHVLWAGISGLIQTSVGALQVAVGATQNLSLLWGGEGGASTIESGLSRIQQGSSSIQRGTLERSAVEAASSQSEFTGRLQSIGGGTPTSAISSFISSHPGLSPERSSEVIRARIGPEAVHQIENQFGINFEDFVQRRYDQVHSEGVGETSATETSPSLEPTLAASPSTGGQVIQVAPVLHAVVQLDGTAVGRVITDRAMGR